MDKKALEEMGKEVFRLALFAGVSVVVTAGLDQLGNIKDPTLVVAIVTAVLRAIDKYIHEAKNIKLDGLSPV